MRLRVETSLSASALSVSLKLEQLIDFKLTASLNSKKFRWGFGVLGFWGFGFRVV